MTMTTIQKVKSGLYFCLWIFIVVGIEFLWILILPYCFWHTYLFYIGIPIVFGLFIGLVSGYPPRKAFLVGFLGNFVFERLFGVYSFLGFFDFLQLSIFLGLMAIAGAIIRRVLFRDFKELYLSTPEWVILIGGCSAYADYIIFSTADRVFVYQNYLQFFTGVSIVSIGIFALGLYAGAFFNKEYKNPLQKIKKISLAGHTGFILYTILIMFMGATIWRTCLFYSFLGFFVVLFAGAKIGRKYS
jgi:hypothetical protein